MIFSATAEQIQQLDEHQLVELLRKLIQAELRKNKIPLRSGTAPAQITIPDGGEDGRVSWKGGVNQTDYLPSRFVIFQCKKGKVSDSILKKETWTKASQNSGSPVLNEALKAAINQSGAYVLVTPTPVVGTHHDDRIKAIEAGISATDADPSHLSSIDLYDCNRLADWTTTHPSIALWLNSIPGRVNLDGFQPFEAWSTSPDFTEIEFQKSDDARFLPLGTAITVWQQEDSTIADVKTFDEIGLIIAEFLQDRGKAIRIIGPSGFGKTRFVHQLIQQASSSPNDVLDKSQLIFCDYEDVKDRLLNLARSVASSRSRTLLIVDDCPDNIHTKLCEIMRQSGSQAAFISIAVEGNSQGLEENLVVQLQPAPDNLIDKITKTVNDDLSNRHSALIRELSQGYPRMAVFAANAQSNGDNEFTSVDAFLSRIIWGNGLIDTSALESLQLASLFTIVGLDNEAASDLKELSAFQGKQSQKMYQELASFTGRGVITRQGDYGEVQPRPLAMRLVKLWLENNPSGSLTRLFNSLSDGMKLRMIGSLRWVSEFPEVANFAATILAELLPDYPALNSETGSHLLRRMVHIAPDEAVLHLQKLIGGKSIDDLVEFQSGRRNTIWALELLAFRRQSFPIASRLLLRLGAAENEGIANSASGQFKALYPLYLSGTEAPPDEKLTILDEGLNCGDDRIQALCVEALDTMLRTGHFSRMGGMYSIGAGDPLKEWQPKTHGDVYDHYRAALTRLEAVAQDTPHPSAERALQSISDHLRGLLDIEPLFQEIRATALNLRDQYPTWSGLVAAVNSWLYYDGNKEDNARDHKASVRALYDELLPDDDIKQLVIFSTGDTLSFHDPEVPYDRDGDNDYRYAERKVGELVQAVPAASEYFHPVLDHFLHNSPNSMSGAPGQIAAHVSDPENLIAYLIEGLTVDKNEAVVAGLISGSLFGLQSNKGKALECLDIALQVERLQPYAIPIITSLDLDDDLMQRVIQYVESGVAHLHHVGQIGYGDPEKAVSLKSIESLIDALSDAGHEGAIATLDFLTGMTHDKKLNDERIANLLKHALVNPSLLDEPIPRSTAWYSWYDMAEKLINDGYVDEPYCEQLVDFIVGVVHIEDSHIQFEFEDYAQKVLRLAITISPGMVWEKFQEAHEQSEGMTAYSLKKLFKSGIGEPTSAGVLADLPSTIYIPWMLEKKPERLPFILSWIGLFADDTAKSNWAPDFVSFVDEHVDNAGWLDPIRTRLTTGTSWGSIANRLEQESDKLQRLKQLSSNSAVHLWIDQTRSSLSREIVEWRRRDANREAAYRA